MICPPYLFYKRLEFVQMYVCLILVYKNVCQICFCFACSRMDFPPFGDRLQRLQSCPAEYGPFEGSPSEPPSVFGSAPSQSVNIRARVGSWNVRGCVRIATRNIIDEFLFSLGLDVVCLQETHMVTGQTLTRHYSWFNSGGNAQTTSRGVSILVRRSVPLVLLVWKPISDSLCLLRLRLGEGAPVRFLNAHVPSDGDRRMPVVVSMLRSQLSRLPRADLFLLFGDFNARIGRNDLLETEKNSVGTTLRHEICNENGFLLKSLMLDFHLKAVNTFSSSKTVLTTWASRGIESQIDHLLVHRGSSEFVMQSVTAKVSPIHKSDHKLLTGVLIGGVSAAAERTAPAPHLADFPVPGVAFPEAGAVSAETAVVVNNPGSTEDGLKKSIQHGLLQIERVCGEFHAAMDQDLAVHPSSEDIETEWPTLQSVLVRAANKVLDRPVVSSPPVRRALAMYLSAAHKYSRPPNGSTVRERQALRQRRDRARKSLFDVRRAERLQECSRFFEKINDFQPQARLHKTFVYLKSYRRGVQRRATTVYIPMSRWLNLLELQRGPRLSTLSARADGREDDFFPLMAPPTPSDVNSILGEIKGGTAAGTDGLRIELFK